MLKKTIHLFLLIILLTAQGSLAAALSIGERLKINSTYLNEEREIQVLLPESYHSNKEANYPVIYLLDGDYNFHGVSGMLDFLSNKAQLIPDVILVGIADKGTDVYRQYMTPAALTAPFKKEDAGKAELFLTFLEKELKPYINNHYRAANNSILFGGSIGGLFVLNALFESPNAFEHFVSNSPSVWLNDHGIMAKANSFVGESEHKPTSLYLSLGDEERQGVYGVLQLLDEKQPKNIDWQFSHYPDENHNSVGLVALRADLKKIFKTWHISDKKLESSITPEQILAHYQKLSAKLAINQPIPTSSIKSAIRSFYRQKKVGDIPSFMAKMKKILPTSEQAFIMMQASYIGYFDSPQSALKVLLEAESRFEYSVEYIKSIAVIYMQLNNTDMAINYYTKALKLAKLYNANQWQINIIEAKLLELKA
ncbi:alpha/beta hydrolase-fold protein [Colwellia psychrerythraea]|uniref:Esterase n=1 Tax=Colwellia psychrerythraea TaxID=28229 RepID=A0A099KP53_COLPS|nr:alpha/beta hydrolase-fold protein [Colwellia psychrerythraea]KGJ92276.1 esterase [Colwellia psychrerythraea]